MNQAVWLTLRVPNVRVLKQVSPEDFLIAPPPRDKLEVVEEDV